MVNFLTNKAHVWYYTIKRDREGHRLHPIERWKDFKKLFLKKLLPIGFQSHMHSELHKLSQGRMFVTKFEFKSLINTLHTSLHRRRSSAFFLEKL